MTTLPANIVVSQHPTREQLEQIFNILGEVFPVDRAFFQERLDFDSTYNPDTTWFATVDGTIGSTIQIFPLHMRVGSCVLKIGGIGSVGTDPNFRGQGLALHILQEQISWMQSNDYDMSMLLASIHPFYEKLGWQLITEKAYTLKNPARTAPKSNYDIIPFAPTYMNEMQAIYERFNYERTYSIVRNETYWNDLVHWPTWKEADCLLLQMNNQIVAYGRIGKTINEKAYMEELVYLQEAEHQVIDLFLSLCQLRPEAQYIWTRVPDDHKLAAYFKQQHAETFELDLTMWKMIRLLATFQKLKPELQARLNNTSALSAFHLELQCKDETVYLDYENEKLTISAIRRQARNYQTIAVEERRLITYIMFGYQEQEHADQLEARSILQALFPVQHAAFYATDNF